MTFPRLFCTDQRYSRVRNTRYTDARRISLWRRVAGRSIRAVAFVSLATSMLLGTLAEEFNL